MKKKVRNKIIILAYERRKKLEQADGSLENLKYCFADLLTCCGPFWPVLSQYMALLDDVSNLISADEAFEAGQRYYSPDRTMGMAISAYMAEVESRPSTQRLRSALQDGYDLLVKITGLSGLVTEFVHEYELLYGLSSVLPFFEYGFILQSNLANKKDASK